MLEHSINIAYLFMLIALTIKNILFLRIVLVSAQCIFIIYGVIFQNYVLVFWNSVFIVINTVQIILLYIQRKPIAIPNEIQDIYGSVFYEMSPREFLYFWQIGKIYELANDYLVRNNRLEERLILLLHGKAIVKRGGKDVAILGRGDFVAEMSFITGEPTSADVYCPERISFIVWHKENIISLEKLNPKIRQRLQHVISKDLIKKVKKK